MLFFILLSFDELQLPESIENVHKHLFKKLLFTVSPAFYGGKLAIAWQ